MKVEYSKRATADLLKVSADSRVFGDVVAAAVQERIHEIVEYLADHPEASPRVAERPGMHVVPLGRYPYKIFYRILEDKIRILHIRHTAPAMDRGTIVSPKVRPRVVQSAEVRASGRCCTSGAFAAAGKSAAGKSAA